MTAGALGDWLEGMNLGWIHGSAMPSPPTTLYLSLLTANPSDMGSLSAPSAPVEAPGNGGTSRTSIGSPGTATTAPAPIVGQTAQQITFPGSTVTITNTSGATWAVTGVALWDGNTGTGSDHLLGYLPLTFLVANGQGLQFAPWSLMLTQD